MSCVEETAWFKLPPMISQLPFVHLCSVRSVTLPSRISGAGAPSPARLSRTARLISAAITTASAMPSVGCGQASQPAEGAAPTTTMPVASSSPNTGDTAGAGGGTSSTPSSLPSSGPTSSTNTQSTLSASEPTTPTSEASSEATTTTTTGTGSDTATEPPTTSPPTGTLELTGLTVEPNPNSVLSAYVSWTTASAASSVVMFGTDDYTWQIVDEAPVVNHRVLVIGMRAESKYRIKALSSNAEGSGEALGEFTTGTLPAGIPVGEVTAYDATQAQPGWTLINVQVGDGTYRARSAEPPMAVIYDEEGQPVWYVISGSSPDIGGAVSTELTDVGVLVGPQMQGGASPREFNLAGDIVWECADPRCGGTADLSHHAGKLPNGHFVVNRDVNVGGVTMPVFEEFAPPENTVVWSLDLRSILPPPQGTSGDWCHGNALTVHAADDAVYVSCRFLGVIKTTYDNPQLVWHLPASYGAQGMGDFTFDPPESQFSDIHDPEIHEDNTVLVFDNGGWAGALGEYNPTGLKSRVVEYQLDETAGVAKRVWEFPGDFEVDEWYRSSWYQPFWGDADRLENGNVLMTSGVRGPDLRSRVFEATRETGEVVWEMQLPPDYGLYRADRIPALVAPVTQ